MVSDVAGPVRLIVGDHDDEGLAQSRRLQGRLRSHSDVVIAIAARPSFRDGEELERVAQLAVDWFTHHLSEVAARA